MAVDLSIQVFSYELFNTIFIDHGIVSRQPLSKEILNTIYYDYKGEVHVNSDIVHAVYTRQAIFHDVYRLQFDYTDIASCDSPSDFLMHMCAAFSSRQFKELKVFEHIFATCTFVVEMCLYCSHKRNSYFIGDAYLCWAMYFDTELKYDFYEQGGWNVLKSVARSYITPFLVIKSCVNYETMHLHRSLLHTAHLQKLVTGMKDFYHFQTFSDPGENLTCAKPWVNFRLSRSSQDSNRTEFDIKSIEGLEYFLRCFKFLCDPLGEMVLDSVASSQNLFSKSAFPINNDLTNITMKLSHCNIESCTTQDACFEDNSEASALPKGVQGLTDAVHALTLEIQALEAEQHSKSDTPANNRSQKETSNDNSKKGILSIYDQIKDFLNVDYVSTALGHVSVFMRDHYRNKDVMKTKLKLDNPPQTKQDLQTVMESNYQLPMPSKHQEIPDEIKDAKKKRNAEDETVSEVVYSTNKTGASTDTKPFPNVTKDLLRMVLVLGCQPGVNYIRSTLKDSTKTTSF